MMLIRISIRTWNGSHPCPDRKSWEVLFHSRFYYTAFFTKFIQNSLHFYQICSIINKKGGHIL